MGGNGASRSLVERRTKACWIIRENVPGDSERSWEQGLPDELTIYNFL